MLYCPILTPVELAVLCIIRIILYYVIVIVIVMSKHRDGESTPDGGTPQWENLCAHAAQTLFTRTKHTLRRTNRRGLRLRGRKLGIVYGACDTAHARGVVRSQM